MKQTNYSKAAMKAMTDLLPRGTMNQVAAKLNIPYTTVMNVCHGKQFKKEVVTEIERRYNQLKKSLASK